MSLRLEASHIRKHYDNRPVLKDCSYTFDRHGTYVLMGPNGCGKSTFLRICALLEAFDGGSLSYYSEEGPLPLDLALRRRITLVLPKIGAAARRYFLTGERFGADVALRIGLVQEVAEDAGEAAEAIVESLLAGGPEAVRAAKRLVRERPQGIETARIAAERRTSAEGQDGLRAFLKRRPPGWATRRS